MFSYVKRANNEAALHMFLLFLFTIVGLHCTSEHMENGRCIEMVISATFVVSANNLDNIDENLIV